MSTASSRIRRPELFIAISGPIGVDVDSITGTLEQALRDVRYHPVPIRLTQEMIAFPADVELRTGDFFEDSDSKMRYGNAVRELFGDPAALARIGVLAVRARRALLTSDANRPSEGAAYIIRQLKRPEEVECLRRIYGPQFLLISAYGAREQRKGMIQEQLRQTMPTMTNPGQIGAAAERLIETDADEHVPFGQQLRNTFHRGDVFIDGLSRPEMENNLSRFVNAFFGRTDIGPTKDEFGMFMARAAALRSTDLSRQVGAAICTPDGELIALGCNEVPRAFGGAYWDMESPDFRDAKLGHDPNVREIREVLRDLFERLKNAGHLADSALEMGAPSEIVEELSRTGGILADATVNDLTEYGRVVHAEMHAITEAARLGRSVRNAILYSTTFPCHNCTKHILAAGIRRVVYIEPYPKSRAAILHAHEIEVENSSHERVEFKPFMGIAPNRYRDIFEKGRRKDANGRAKRWFHDEASPMVNVTYPGYFAPEVYELRRLIEART